MNKCSYHKTNTCPCDDTRKRVDLQHKKVKNDYIVEATCWDKRNGEKPPIRLTRKSDGKQFPEISEIIEVGVCLLSVKTGERSDKRSILVKPAMSTVGNYCTELTGHTQESLDEHGIPFGEACEILINDYKTRERVWASYGQYDRNMFKRQCGLFHGPIYPFSDEHVNVKKQASLYQKRSKDTGMKRCLTEWYNIPMSGRHHNGADDAWNIAAILGTAFRFNRNREGEVIHDYRKAS